MDDGGWTGLNPIPMAACAHCAPVDGWRRRSESWQLVWDWLARPGLVVCPILPHPTTHPPGERSWPGPFYLQACPCIAHPTPLLCPCCPLPAPFHVWCFPPTLVTLHTLPAHAIPALPAFPCPTCLPCHITPPQAFPACFLHVLPCLAALCFPPVWGPAGVWRGGGALLRLPQAALCGPCPLTPPAPAPYTLYTCRRCA